MGGKRERHPPRFGLETILSWSESLRGIVLPGCHLPNSHEQFFARLDRRLVQDSPPHGHIQKNHQLGGSRIGGIQKGLARQ